jgi:hypothetical protein
VSFGAVLGAVDVAEPVNIWWSGAPKPPVPGQQAAAVLPAHPAKLTAWLPAWLPASSPPLPVSSHTRSVSILLRTAPPHSITAPPSFVRTTQHHTTTLLIVHCPGPLQIPTANDIPIDFRVTLLRNSPCERTPMVHSSKAVGEPPFFLGERGGGMLAVWVALAASFAGLCLQPVWVRKEACEFDFVVTKWGLEGGGGCAGHDGMPRLPTPLCSVACLLASCLFAPCL